MLKKNVKPYSNPLASSINKYVIFTSLLDFGVFMDKKKETPSSNCRTLLCKYHLKNPIRFS